MSKDRHFLRKHQCTRDPDHILIEYFQDQRMEAVQFLARGLAHDLTNALTGLFLLCSKLRKKASPDIWPHIQGLEERLEQIEKLVHSLKDLGEEKGQRIPQALELSVWSYKMAVEILSPFPEVTLFSKKAPSCLPVKIFPEELYRIILNILTKFFGSYGL
ncbi:hypothetical protein [Thermosulfuriphilus sp.]